MDMNTIMNANGSGSHHNCANSGLYLTLWAKRGHDCGRNRMDFLASGISLWLTTSRGRSGARASVGVETGDRSGEWGTLISCMGSNAVVYTRLVWWASLVPRPSTLPCTTGVGWMNTRGVRGRGC
jgi:hypothetical protein